MPYIIATCLCSFSYCPVNHQRSRLMLCFVVFLSIPFPLSEPTRVLKHTIYLSHINLIHCLRLQILIWKAPTSPIYFFAIFLVAIFSFLLWWLFCHVLFSCGSQNDLFKFNSIMKLAGGYNSTCTRTQLTCLLVIWLVYFCVCEKAPTIYKGFQWFKNAPKVKNHCRGRLRPDCRSPWDRGLTLGGWRVIDWDTGSSLKSLNRGTTESETCLSVQARNAACGYKRETKLLLRVLYSFLKGLM